MNIGVLSDVHLEFAPLAPCDAAVDVLLLPGDIHNGVQGVAWASAARAPHVLYVAGNHEYWGHDLPGLIEDMKRAALGTAVRVLEDECAVINGVRFLACTLWTDFALFGGGEQIQFAMDIASDMPDFRYVRTTGEWRRLRPSDTLRKHESSLAWLHKELAAPFDGPTVVVTHHAPSSQSSRDAFRNDVFSAAFVSSLDDFIEAHSIDLWVHGHTHWCVDYKIGKTRVVSNQRGYPKEGTGHFQDVMIIDV